MIEAVAITSEEVKSQILIVAVSLVLIAAGYLKQVREYILVQIIDVAGYLYRSFLLEFHEPILKICWVTAKLKSTNSRNLAAYLVFCALRGGGKNF